MPKIILQPAAGSEAREHFQDTIERPVSLAANRDLLGPHYDALLKRFPAGTCAMWGVTPGRNDVNVAKYERASVGDAVLFAGGGRFFAIGTVAYMWHSPKLAVRLWGRDHQGQTWEYMYALDDLRDIDVPYAEFNRAVGYAENNVPQGFNVLSDERSAEAFRLLPESRQRIPEISEEQYEEAVRDFPEELDQQVRGVARVEQGYLRRRLFGTRPTGTCALCGCELPVDLLVAAHIKKRSACTHVERLDVDHIVMAACRLGCDDLYELGYISIDEDGTIVASVPEKVRTAAVSAAVDRVTGRQCAAFSEGSAAYFAWHRSHVFRS